MPLYEYRCSTCGAVFEVMQKFSDAPLATHQGCGGAVERLISAPGLHFKGSGWYITDYARSSKSGSQPGESKPAESKPAEGKSGGDASKGSESKTPAKPAGTTKSD